MEDNFTYNGEVIPVSSMTEDQQRGFAHLKMAVSARADLHLKLEQCEVLIDHFGKLMSESLAK